MFSNNITYVWISPQISIKNTTNIMCNAVWQLIDWENWSSAICSLSYWLTLLLNHFRNLLFWTKKYVGHENHSHDFVWYFDDGGPWIPKPTGRGGRLIVINAITKNRWVPGAKLTFKSSRKTGDYHGQINQKLFTKD